jgi:hypothetical protein
MRMVEGMEGRTAPTAATATATASAAEFAGRELIAGDRRGVPLGSRGGYGRAAGGASTVV